MRTGWFTAGMIVGWFFGVWMTLDAIKEGRVKGMRWTGKSHSR